MTLEHLISCFKIGIRLKPLFFDLNDSHILYQYPSKHSGDAQNKKQTHTTSLSKYISYAMSWWSYQLFTFYILTSTNNLKSSGVSENHIFWVVLRKTLQKALRLLNVQSEVKHENKVKTRSH